MIPVAAARTLAETYSQSIVLVVGYEPETGKTNVVTYGVSADDKSAAAIGGERIAEVLNLGKMESHEDYRRAGERAESFDQLLRCCKAASSAYKSLLAVREGLTDEFIVSLAATTDFAIEDAESQTI